MDILNSLISSFQKMEPVDWVIFIIALLSYLPLIYAVAKNIGAEQTFSSWIMWLLLDIISLGIQIQIGKSYAVLLAFTIGSLGVTLLLLLKRKIKWERDDTRYGLLVVLCSIVWFSSGEYWGAIFATFSQMAASFPQLKMTWRKPDVQALPSYTGFWLANVITAYSATEWSVPSRFFSVTLSIFGILFLIPMINKLLRKIKYRNPNIKTPTL